MPSKWNGLAYSAAAFRTDLFPGTEAIKFFAQFSDNRNKLECFTPNRYFILWTYGKVVPIKSGLTLK
jgi:hypothetical protein